MASKCKNFEKKEKAVLTVSRKAGENTAVATLPEYIRGKTQ